MNPASQRAGSKLSLIRLLLSHPEGIELEKLAQLRGQSVAETKRELGELYMIETYPYTPMDCVEVQFEGNRVKISVPVSIQKSINLTPIEWHTLQKLVTDPITDRGSDHIATIQKKISNALGIMESDLHNTQIQTLRRACETRNYVSFSYWKRYDQAWDMRKVIPISILETEHLYLLAYDPSKFGVRSFRMDLIKDLEVFPEIGQIPEEFPIESFRIEESAQAKLWVAESALYHFNQRILTKSLNTTKIISKTLYHLLEADVPNKDWFIDLVIGYGKNILLISPTEWKIEIIDKLNIN